MRGLLCWGIGMGFLWAIPDKTFDTRFKIRGQQNPSKEIVLIHIQPSEWSTFLKPDRNWLRRMKETGYDDDSYFWSAPLWRRILTKALLSSPDAIGVNLLFSDLNLETRRKLLKSNLFMNPKVYYAAITDKNGELIAPSLARTFEDNIGSYELTPDADGILRRFHAVGGYSKQLVARLVGLQPHLQNHAHRIQSPELINFQGKRNSYTAYSLTDFLSDDFDLKSLKNKIVIIGADESKSHTFLTPIGPISRSEVIANIVDNHINNLWVKTPHWTVPALCLILLLIVGIWLMSSLPQSVALVSLFWMGMGWTVFSFWIFDTHYIWLPILPVLVQLSVIYVIFLSYQLTISDYQKWQLEQEAIYHREVEELKNNFVSLISHDLKTPIAKMQAICDRVLSQNPESGFTDDLLSLRNESSELHRYIQTILQITRAESKDFKPNKDAADINKIVEDVVSRLESLAKERQISMHLNLEPLFLIEVDPVMIREVILNLVENAIKYSKDGGEIEVETQEINDLVKVIVRDNGVGIPPADLERIFEKFYRGRQEKSSIKGSGLGLYLVKYFVELHNGELRIKSEDDIGTEVTISLPTFEESELPLEVSEGIDSPSNQESGF